MNDIWNKVCLDIQAQICSCALLQLAYDNHLGRVPEFIPSTEKILVPGGSCFLVDRDRPSLYLLSNKEMVFSFLADVPVSPMIAICSDHMKQTDITQMYG